MGSKRNRKYTSIKRNKRSQSIRQYWRRIRKVSEDSKDKVDPAIVEDSVLHSSPNDITLQPVWTSTPKYDHQSLGAIDPPTTISSDPSHISLDVNTSSELVADDSFGELTVEIDDNYKGPKTPSRRAICDINHVIEQSKGLHQHSFTCSFGGEMVFMTEKQSGLNTIWTYRCNNNLCAEVITISTNPDSSALNSLAVLGALTVGSGFAQEEERFNTMNMRYMCHPTFIKVERQLETYVQDCLLHDIEMAIDEEKMATWKGKEISDSQYCEVTVVVDGGWCKRTYGHSYNASSGVAVIMGYRTSKILFLGVRNKLCLICMAATEEGKEPKEHTCYKNWTGSSTKMEADIIVEGLRHLKAKYNIRAMRVIGDGDSNTMASIRTQIEDGHCITKIECANHVIRCYGRHIDALIANTQQFSDPEGVKARKLLKQRKERLIRGARIAIVNHFKSKTGSSAELRNILRNGPSHVFGYHANCGPFCTRHNDNEQETFNVMKESKMLAALQLELERRVISKTESLIFNVTNNAAENFMAQFAKTIGGKRVDFSRSGGVGRRAAIAALATNAGGPSWHSDVNKLITGSSPQTPLKTMIERRSLRNAKRRLQLDVGHVKKKKRQELVSKGGDEFYGFAATEDDMTPEFYTQQSQQFLNNLKVNSNDELEKATRGQHLNLQWKMERHKRLSATHFKDVFVRRPTTLSAGLVKRILYPADCTYSAAISYGQFHEMKAREEYSKLSDVVVQECGLFVDPAHPYLSCSPDGLVGEDGLVEIKCPYLARETQSLEAATNGGDIGVKFMNNQMVLPRTHKYFHQIQGQLALTDRQWCDLFIWSPNDNRTLRIERDQTFWSNILPKLTRFYEDCLLPELVDSRAKRKMPLREPNYITAAIAKKKSQESPR